MKNYNTMIRNLGHKLWIFHGKIIKLFLWQGEALDKYLGFFFFSKKRVLRYLYSQVVTYMCMILFNIDIDVKQCLRRNRNRVIYGQAVNTFGQWQAVCAIIQISFSCTFPERKSRHYTGWYRITWQFLIT